MNPLASVRSSCQRVADAAGSVFINDDAIEVAADDILSHKSENSLTSHNIDWNNGWHYCADAPGGPLTCQYIFVLDALNFCFWPTDGLEYDYLATSLKTVMVAQHTLHDFTDFVVHLKVLEADCNAFSAENLMAVTTVSNRCDGMRVVYSD